MKIAEALALRADLQKHLEQLKQRLVKNARIQEGDRPEEDPVELQSELEKSAAARSTTVLSALAALDLEMVIRPRTKSSAKDIEAIF